MDISGVKEASSLDELMHAIRLEIEGAGQPLVGGMQTVFSPEAAHTPQSSLPPSPGQKANRKTIARRLDVRILIQRLLGIRRVVKLGKQLEPLRHSPVPLHGLPGAVSELRKTVSEIDKLKLQTTEAAARVKKLEEKSGEDLATVYARISELSSRYDTLAASVSTLHDSKARVSELSSRYDTLAASVNTLHDSTARVSELSSRYDTLAASVSTLHDSKARVSELSSRCDTLAASVNTLHDSTARITRRAADQGRRLDLLITEARSRLPQPLSSEQIETFEEVGKEWLGALYVDFEDRFRGERSDIARRQNVYLDHARDAVAQTGMTTFLDIGCGRGEFLELLKNAGFEPRGVDSNAVMVAICRNLGLEATKADGIHHLREVPKGQLAGVSGFHIIEHIPFDVLIQLLDAALHALAPGGVLILETPNPANLLVAAERFYSDPTHRNPLPSEMMAFMVEARGFVDVQVMPLQPVDHLPRQYDDPMLALLQEKLYGPQDYGIVARKSK